MKVSSPLRPAALIRAFGVDGAARASFAPYTLESDIDALLEGLEGLVHGKPRPKRADAAPRSQPP